jgi:hypothetical protein
MSKDAEKKCGRGKAGSTLAIEQALISVLTEVRPMTVRQAYYALVTKLVVENAKTQYNRVCRALADLRLRGVVPWEWVEDRTRRPRTVNMWESVSEFAEDAIRWFRLDVWREQETLVEVWLEKDALSGIFEEVLEPYGVTLCVGRGYDGWDSIHLAAERYKDWGGDVLVCYFGDHDPSGEDMQRSLRDRLEQLGASPEIRRIGILSEDIERYQLPPNPAKPTDSRYAGYVAQHGKDAVELDALPVDVLRSRIREAVESAMDMDAYHEVIEKDNDLRGGILTALVSIERDPAVESTVEDDVESIVENHEEQ